MRLFLTICFLVATQTPVIAADDSAQSFMETCKNFSIDQMQKEEVGFCAGVVETMMAVGPVLMSDWRFCPGHAPVAEGYAAINKYVKDHPDALKRGRMDLLTLALKEEWPCE
jgi:Rap1a immunity proteins